LEQTNKNSKSYSFRIGHGAMKSLESMAQSNYTSVFEE